MKINGKDIVSANYNDAKKQYEFYDMGGGQVAVIKSKRLKLPMSNHGKAWEILERTFGDPV